MVFRAVLISNTQQFVTTLYQVNFHYKNGDQLWILTFLPCGIYFKHTTAIYARLGHKSVIQIATCVADRYWDMAHDL